jgi:hypothetical protein
LFGALHDRVRKCFEARVREEFDQLRQADGRRRRIKSVEQAQRVDAIRMVDGEINRCGPTSVVSNRNDLIQVQRFDNRFQVVVLLFEAVVSACRLVGSSKTQEVKRDNPAPCGD